MVISIKEEQILTHGTLNNQKANYDSNYDSSVLGNTFTFPRCQRISYFYWKKDDRNQGLFGHLQQKLIQSDLSFENGVWRQLVGLCFSGRGGRPLHILGAGSVSSLECLSVTFKYVQYLLFSLSGPRHLIGFNLDFGIGQDKSGTFSFWAHKGSHFFLSFFPCSV